MDLKKELKVAKNLAVLSGIKILEIYNNDDFSVDYKEDESPLTIADKKSNEIIVSNLKSFFPEYSILSEESAEDESRFSNDYCWVVDPLDGTKEFIKKNDEFTVNIALTYKNKPILGVVYVPVGQKLYYASKDFGAFLSTDNKIKKISVSNKEDNLRLTASRSHASEKLKELIINNNIKNVIKAGSSLKGCLIAEGKADIYYRFNPTMEWDTAAMHCIIEEAGGIFKQMDDSEMTYNRKDNVNRKGFYILNKKTNRIY